MEDKLNWKNLENKGWQQMEELLDKEMPVARSFYLWQILVACLALLSMGVFLFTEKPIPKPLPQMKTKITSPSIDAELAYAENLTYPNSENKDDWAAVSELWQSHIYAGKDVFRLETPMAAPDPYFSHQPVSTLAQNTLPVESKNIFFLEAKRTFDIAPDNEAFLEGPEISRKAVFQPIVRFDGSTNFNGVFEENLSIGLGYPIGERLEAQSFISGGHAYLPNKDDLAIDPQESAYLYLPSFAEAPDIDELQNQLGSFHQYQFGLSQSFHFEILPNLYLGAFAGANYIALTKSYSERNIYYNIVNRNRTIVQEGKLNKGNYNQFTSRFYIHHGLNLAWDIDEMWSLSMFTRWQNPFGEDEINAASKRRFGLGLGVSARI